MRNKIIHLIAFMAMTGLSGAASIEEIGGSVAAGCAKPTANVKHRFYVDPINGSMSGDGSRSHPWRTLAEVVDVRNKLIANEPETWQAGVGKIKPNPNAPIKSGDAIYLMSGDHGEITLQGNFGTNNHLYGYNNEEFVTIAAAPGQKPVIKQLTLKGVDKWAFRGLTFESLQDVPSNQGRPYKPGNGTHDYFLATMTGPNSNVIFDGNHFLSQNDVNSWNREDWLGKRVNGIVAIAGNCLTITNNKIENIGTGLGFQRGSNILIKDNTIDTYVDDGIDFGSDNTVIEGNSIINSIDDGDGEHQDGMQGQPLGQNPVTNVTITNNIVINQTKDLVAPANLQGIDAFDGVWHNVTITNNIVAVNAYHGIAFAGVFGIRIINNTVVGTNSKIPTWITVGPSKDKRPSEDIVVRNNVATLFVIRSPSNNFDHNMMLSLTTKGVKTFKPDAHVIADQEPISVFEKYNNSFHSYDFHLAPSRAVGSGSLLLAPSLDLDGIRRGAVVDLGALAYKGTRHQ